MKIVQHSIKGLVRFVEINQLDQMFPKNLNVIMGQAVTFNIIAYGREKMKRI